MVWVGKTFIWNKEEENFFFANFNNTEYRELAKHFGVSVSVINNKARKMGLRKDEIIKMCIDCNNEILISHVWNAKRVKRCKNCQKEYKRKILFEASKKLRHDHPEKTREYCKKWYNLKGRKIVADYQKTEKYKEYIKEYQNRPENKEKKKKLMSEYQKTEKFKKWRREYQKRPYVKQKLSEYQKKYRTRKKIFTKR